MDFFHIIYSYTTKLSSSFIELWYFDCDYLTVYIFEWINLNPNRSRPKPKSNNLKDKNNKAKLPLYLNCNLWKVLDQWGQ